MWKQKTEPPTLLNWLDVWKSYEASGSFLDVPLPPNRPPHITFGASREFNIRGVASLNTGTANSSRQGPSWKEAARKANSAIPLPPPPPPGPPPKSPKNQRSKFGYSRTFVNPDQESKMGVKPVSDLVNTWNQSTNDVQHQAAYPVSAGAARDTTDNTGLVYDGEAWVMDLNPQRVVPLPGQPLPTHTRDVPRSLVNQDLSREDRFHANVLRQEQYLRETKARKLTEARKYAAAYGVQDSSGIPDWMIEERDFPASAARAAPPRLDDDVHRRSATPQRQEVSTIPAWESPNTSPTPTVAQPSGNNDTQRRNAAPLTQEWDMSTTWMHRSNNSSQISRHAVHESYREWRHIPPRIFGTRPAKLNTRSRLHRSSYRSGSTGPATAPTKPRDYVTSTGNKNNGQYGSDSFGREPETRLDATPPSCPISAVAQEISRTRPVSWHSVDATQDQDDAPGAPRVKKRRKGP
ncbi:uncharacterized protein PAC_17721 [Phialocephala subalpina]|uniref:Uncharacterized protein n=1 Tax=Phialocephala subalpina TaxID=576137 RepID=A0A1L7XRZ3_9HELO|nr:uncharacterized protein PAC_17721 [Phialocephala subalpina]